VDGWPTEARQPGQCGVGLRVLCRRRLAYQPVNARPPGADRFASMRRAGALISDGCLASGLRGGVRCCHKLPSRGPFANSSFESGNTAALRQGARSPQHAGSSTPPLIDLGLHGGELVVRAGRGETTNGDNPAYGNNCIRRDRFLHRYATSIRKLHARASALASACEAWNAKEQ
jgi:hypothetical protein